MSDINIKRLISPFSLGGSKPLQKKQATRSLCRCDSDDDQEMAPECAFVCNTFSSSLDGRKTTKKRRSNSHARAKKTKRNKKN